MKYSLTESCRECDARLPLPFNGHTLCPDCRLPVRCKKCDNIVEAVYRRLELCEDCYVRGCRSIEDSCRVPSAVLAGAIELHREVEAEKRRERRAIELQELIGSLLRAPQQDN